MTYPVNDLTSPYHPQLVEEIDTTGGGLGLPAPWPLPSNLRLKTLSQFNLVDTDSEQQLPAIISSSSSRQRSALLAARSRRHRLRGRSQP